MSIAIEFIGAAQTVTGSRHLVRTPHGNVLLDCGLYQGRRAEARERNLDLGFDPSQIHVVVLSHAHIDHSGALPLLSRNGYAGPIFATPATMDLCALMLEDAASIQISDARYLNRAIERDGVDADPIEPLYDQEDVARVMERFVPLAYHQRRALMPGVTLEFFDAGHVLGSAVVVLDIEDEGTTKRLVFSGDLGRPELPLLRPPEVPPNANVLLLESTYGDRLHPARAQMDEELGAVIERTHARGGKIIIPSFALERAQEVVYSLHQLVRQKRIRPIPVYVDSPLTVGITEIFRRHPECLDEEARALLSQGDSPFELPGLKYVSSLEDSMAIDASDAPAIIISASGMCEAGRVLHHLRKAVEDPRNSVVIVGFQAQHTLGRRLVERRARVRIFGLEHELRADVVVLNGFSAHADQTGLIEFATAIAKTGKLAWSALVHGEPRPQATLGALLEARGVAPIVRPAPGEIHRF